MCLEQQNVFPSNTKKIYWPFIFAAKWSTSHYLLKQQEKKKDRQLKEQASFVCFREKLRVKLRQKEVYRDFLFPLPLPSQPPPPPPLPSEPHRDS